MTPSTTRRDFLSSTSAAVVGGLLACSSTSGAAAGAKVVVWDERQASQKEAYDTFLGNAIADHLKTQPGLAVTSVGLNDPGRGLTREVLDDARVIVWWGHVRQNEVPREVGKAIVERIKAGKLGLITLHSAHWSIPFIEAMYERTRLDARRQFGDKAELVEVPPPKPNTLPQYDTRLTPYCHPRKFPDGSTRVEVHLPYCVFPAYRHDAKPSQVNVLKPEHPIAQGLPRQFSISRTEMYDEPFHVPEPDEVIFEERWETGEWFRSGMLWKIGKGHVFYFRPGHETYPVYREERPLKVMANAVNWLAAQTA